MIWNGHVGESVWSGIELSNQTRDQNWGDAWTLRSNLALVDELKVIGTNKIVFRLKKIYCPFGKE